jgi:hypothetical protein
MGTATAEQGTESRAASGQQRPCTPLLMRYSGLRIGDAVTLPVARMVDGKVFLRTAKQEHTLPARFRPSRYMLSPSVRERTRYISSGRANVRAAPSHGTGIASWRSYSTSLCPERTPSPIPRYLCR